MAILVDCRIFVLVFFFTVFYSISEELVKVPIAANYKGVGLQNTSESHSYHLKIWQLL